MVVRKARSLKAGDMTMPLVLTSLTADAYSDASDWAETAGVGPGPSGSFPTYQRSPRWLAAKSWSSAHSG